MAEEQVYPFDIYFEHITIFNPDYDSNKQPEAYFRITSTHHLGPQHNTSNIITSTVKFDIDQEFAREIFNILEEHL